MTRTCAHTHAFAFSKIRARSPRLGQTPSQRPWSPVIASVWDDTSLIAWGGNDGSEKKGDVNSFPELDD